MELKAQEFDRESGRFGISVLCCNLDLFRGVPISTCPSGWFGSKSVFFLDHCPGWKAKSCLQSHTLLTLGDTFRVFVTQANYPPIYFAGHDSAFYHQ